MRIRTFGLLVASLAVVACTRPAAVPRNISFEDVINKIHCELRDAVWKTNHLPRRRLLSRGRNMPRAVWRRNWKASIQLKLQTARDGTLSATGNFTAPIHRGKFSLGLIGSLKKKATNSTTFNFDVFMDDLGNRVPIRSTYKFDAKLCENLENAQRGRRRLLSGDLGITDWLQRAAAAYGNTSTTPTGQTYFVEFVITLSGSAKPGFNITSPTGETYAVTVSAGAERVRTHQLTVTLGEVPGTVVDKQLVALNNILEILKKQRIADLNRQLTGSGLQGFAAPKAVDKDNINDEIRALKAISTVNPNVSLGDGNIMQQQILDAISRIETNSRN